MSAVKVLLAGDCLGGFDALFKKVAAVNKKNGPFDLLVCVGQFFEEASTYGIYISVLQKAQLLWRRQWHAVRTRCGSNSSPS